MLLILLLKNHSFNLPKRRTAVFLKAEQIPKNSDYFDIIYLPVEEYASGCGANGIYMPPTIFDSEWDKINTLLERARGDGVRYALASNIGQIKTLKKYGFEIMADFRFNAFNGPCVKLLLENGISNVILSPELTLPQINDLRGASVVAYGKIPVMTTHKCILKDTMGCDKCQGEMTDRQGAKFYVKGAFGHRNIIYNSVPIYMADRLDRLLGHSLHFIFTNEGQKECSEIIDAYKRGKEPTQNVKRIK